MIVSSTRYSDISVKLTIVYICEREERKGEAEGEEHSLNNALV